MEDDARRTEVTPPRCLNSGSTATTQLTPTFMSAPITDGGGVMFFGVSRLSVEFIIWRMDGDSLVQLFTVDRQQVRVKPMTSVI